jgi:hypothetical protein
MLCTPAPQFHILIQCELAQCVCGVHSMCDQYQYLLAILLHSLHSLFTYSFVVRMFATSSPLAHMTHMTLFYTSLSLSLSLSLSRLQSCLLYSLLDMAHTERDCYSMTQRSYCSLSLSLSLPLSLSPRCLSLLVHLLSIRYCYYLVATAICCCIVCIDVLLLLIDRLMICIVALCISPPSFSLSLSLSLAVPLQNNNTASPFASLLSQSDPPVVIVSVSSPQQQPLVPLHMLIFNKRDAIIAWRVVTVNTTPYKYQEAPPTNSECLLRHCRFSLTVTPTPRKLKYLLW